MVIFIQFIYRADLLLEILDSLLKTVSFLETLLTVARCGRGVDVGNTAPRHKVGECLALGAAWPGMPGNRRSDPGMSKLQLLTVFRQS